MSTETNRLLIVDGHVRPAPLIETGTDPITGQKIITNEVHYAPRPVHLALDPDTGSVYAGYAPHEALGIDPPDADLSAADSAREFEAFRAWKAGLNDKLTDTSTVAEPGDVNVGGNSIDAAPHTGDIVNVGAVESGE